MLLMEKEIITCGFCYFVLASWEDLYKIEMISEIPKYPFTPPTDAKPLIAAW